MCSLQCLLTLTGNHFRLLSLTKIYLHSTLYWLLKVQLEQFIVFDYVCFFRLQILLKLQVGEEMLLWLEEWRQCLLAQLMEILSPKSNGTMKKLEKRFQVGNSWKQGKVGATLVLQVTLLGHQLISHSAWLLVSQMTLMRLWPNCTIVTYYERICDNRLQSFLNNCLYFEMWTTASSSSTELELLQISF